ncbi:hypothetical protein SESBI_12386 [Sesbania bispinosa]|nr:hypothetical protein SESBI_12386 [Sesbania bispinosa]
MANIPESTVNPPPTMDQRIEKPEWSLNQVLDLLNTLINNKETTNDNLNNDNSGGGPSNQTIGGKSPKVMIVSESSGPNEKVMDEKARMMSKMEMPEEKMRALQGIDVYGSLDIQPFTQNQFDSPRKERTKLDPMSVSYSQIYDALLRANLVAPEISQLVFNSPPKWNNSTEICKYHMGALSHDIEKCWSFKNWVQRLRDTVMLNFKEGKEQSSGTIVENNPLPKH